MSGIAMLGMTLVSAIATIAIGGFDIMNGPEAKKNDGPPAEVTVPTLPALPPLPPLTGPPPPAHIKQDTTPDADAAFGEAVKSKISRAFPKIDVKDPNGATYDSYSARVVNHVCNKDTLEFDDGLDGTEHLIFMAALVLLCRGSADLVYLDDSNNPQPDTTSNKKTSSTKDLKLCWANKPVVVFVRYTDNARSLYEIVVHHARERQTFNFTCAVNGNGYGDSNMGDMKARIADIKSPADVVSVVRRYSGNTMYTGPAREMEGRDDCLYTLAALVLDVPDWRDRIDDAYKSYGFMEVAKEALKEHGINNGKYEARRPGITEEPKKQGDDRGRDNRGRDNRGRDNRGRNNNGRRNGRR